MTGRRRGRPRRGPWALVHPGAVPDPTAQHHGEDHLEDLEAEGKVRD